MNRFFDLSQKTQQQLFAEVCHLKSEGFGYKRIRRRIREEFGVKLSLGTLSYWSHHAIKIVGGQNPFEPKPSSELAYVLGVMFGDGALSFNEKKQDYALALEAKDKDFVEKFAGCTSVLLGKEKPFCVCAAHEGLFSTKARSKRLYYFVKSIKENFEVGKPFVEAFPADFVRGLADSEGTASFSSKTRRLCLVVAHSVNLELLKFTQELLWKKFAIQTELRRTKTAGMNDSIINGRLIVRTKDLYALSIYKFDKQKKYAVFVGFTMTRKNQKLNDAIFLLEKFGGLKAASYWGKIYHKEGRYWVRDTTKSIEEMIFDN